MPLFMDVHEKLPEGATAKDVAQAHAADVKTQDQYGVKYMKYWVDEKGGKVFCLVEAPDAATAVRRTKTLSMKPKGWDTIARRYAVGAAARVTRKRARNDREPSGARSVNRCIATGSSCIPRPP
jgi:hypothetical protein